MQDTNFTWPQGEDMVVELRYKEGPTVASSLPVNLASGYTARMDIATPAAPSTILATLDADDIDLSSGVAGPNIVVRLNRSLTLSGGALVSPGSYLYDLFLRNTVTDEQVKILEGVIHVKKSVTLWP